MSMWWSGFLLSFVGNSDRQGAGCDSSNDQGCGCLAKGGCAGRADLFELASEVLQQLYAGLGYCLCFILAKKDR
jgi:hypothetical protein